MSPIRRSGNARSGGALHEETTAAVGAGDSTSAGLGRPSRVSAATALASFNWTDDAIVEVAELESHLCRCKRLFFPFLALQDAFKANRPMQMVSHWYMPELTLPSGNKQPSPFDCRRTNRNIHELLDLSRLVRFFFGLD